MYNTTVHNRRSRLSNLVPTESVYSTPY